ncbi:DUF4870 domain-containing protein [Candidatus Babeliales bacterium]|nr:DUF4870 domain-containing protein [Candidatus Babeliales bacterium]
MEFSGVKKEEKIWATVCHLAGFLGGIPFAGIIIPLIIVNIFKKESPFIEKHGYNVINFGLSFTIYAIAAILTIAAGAALLNTRITILGMILLAIGIISMITFSIIALVSIIKGAFRTSHGKMYQYPFTIKFIKTS